MTDMHRKFLSGAVIADAGLGDRQIRVVANSGKLDRAKDTVRAAGCKLDNYRANPIVLADHNPETPIGNFEPEIKDALEGIITFAPAGISAKADEYCGLYKSGVMKTVSVGFRPIKSEPNKDGGYDFREWELLELSCVAVPCDPGAVVTERALAETQTKAAAGPKIKGLYDVSYLAQLLVNLGYVHTNALIEADIEGDDSPLPAMLANALKVLAEAFLAMSREEVAELLAGHDVEIEVDDPLVLAATTPAQKRWRSALAKSGRALSQANLEHVKALKKCLSALTKCHDDTNSALAAVAGHLDQAKEHAKSLLKAGKKKPKPADDDQADETDEPDGDDDGDDDDVELAAAAARRKRQIEIEQLAAPI